MTIKQRVEVINGLVSFWSFDKGSRIDQGQNRYELQDGTSIPAEIIPEGPLSGYSIELKEGQYLQIPRKDCPALNLHGKNAQVTVLAWIKRKPKSYVQCEAIAGMWNETRKKRQYCLFLNIQLYDSANQVSGHISGVGGPTPGERWCVDVSIGATSIVYNEWTFVGFTYDGHEAKSYINGKFDIREGRNPYSYDLGLFDGDDDGSDFTVGAVDRLGEMGNFFVGQIGGIAVFNRSLSEEEIHEISI